MTKRSWRRFAAAGCLALALGGCKTQDDAVAAASQLASTTKVMSEYYEALDTLLTRNEAVFEVRLALMGTPVRDLSETHRQIEMREAFAEDLSLLAAALTHLTGSSAASDASAAAVKLNAELVNLKAFDSNADETSAVKQGVNAIVLLLQQHDEVKAAKKMAPLTAAVAKFFDAEAPLYDSLNAAYQGTARMVAHRMVDTSQVGVTDVYDVALAPFGLKPALTDPALKPKMSDYLNAEIDRRSAQDVAAGKRATASLSAALHEVDARVQTLAADKPMSLRNAPLTLPDVEKWIQSVLE